MRSLLGFFLLGISFFGTLFFRNYHGDMINHPVVWYSLCLITGMIGAWCVFAIKKGKQVNEIKIHEKSAENSSDKGEPK